MPVLLGRTGVIEELEDRELVLRLVLKLVGVGLVVWEVEVLPVKELPSPPGGGVAACIHSLISSHSCPGVYGKHIHLHQPQPGPLK